ncbi:MAG: biotin/lipoyl-containing protein, partial [Planctomycetota bacterium]
AREGLGRFLCHIDDTHVEGEVHSNDRGEGRLIVFGQVTPFYVARSKSKIDVWIRGRVYSFERVEMSARRAGGASAGPTRTELTAPMPGTVLRVNVSAGDTFTAHQPLIILESMKMEMTLSVPHGGRITTLHCQVGQLVDMSAVLARITPKQDEDSVS